MQRLRSIARRTLAPVISRLALRICGRTALQEAILARFDYPAIDATYPGMLSDQSYAHHHIHGLTKESGTIRGVIVDAVNSIETPIRSALLPGEYNADKSYYAALLGIEEAKIVTAGLHRDMDHEWDYNDAPPDAGQFDVIISQAMLEHLVDPYKHISDLTEHLTPGGHLVLHTHPPGFPYHRHPVDCLRFYPDWFEEVAKRLNLSVEKRYFGNLRICYSLKKAKPRTEP